MARLRKNESVGIPTINNVGDATQVFLIPKDWFIPRKWINFQSLKEKGFDMKGLFDRVGWISFLEKFNT